MTDIKLDLTKAQYQQLLDLLARTRGIVKAHQSGEITLPAGQHNITIEWTAQAVELNIPD